jgi:hypothetical protein
MRSSARSHDDRLSDSLDIIPLTRLGQVGMKNTVGYVVLSVPKQGELIG